MAMVSFSPGINSMAGKVGNGSFSGTDGTGTTDKLHESTKKTFTVWRAVHNMFGLAHSDVNLNWVNSYRSRGMPSEGGNYLEKFPIFSILQTAWDLLEALKNIWNIVAFSYDPQNKFGQPYHLTGRDLFFRINYYYYLCNGTILNTPPSLIDDCVFPVKDFMLSPNFVNNTMFFQSWANIVTPMKIFIKLSPAVSGGIWENHKWFLALIDDVKSNYVVDLFSVWMNKYNVTPFPTQRIHCKCMLVDPATGFHSYEIKDFFSPIL